MVTERIIPERGDVLWVNFSTQRGKEQRGLRPAVVLTHRAYNRRAEILLACPVTTKAKGYTFETPITFDGGSGIALADQVRCLDWTERPIRFAGRISEEQLADIQNKIVRLITGEM